MFYSFKMYKKQNKVSFLYEPVHYSTIKSLKTNKLVKGITGKMWPT